MLAVGQIAPAFEGPSTSGDTVRSEQFRGRPLVLYFYPKAGTGGCTAEANDFARHYPDFERAGVALVGVSVDRLEAQERFADDCHLPFPLIADAEGAIARAFGVRGFLGLAKRVTFCIGADGRVEEVISGLLPGPHVKGALARLARREPSSSPTGPATP